jgi:uncharacterized protein (DUF1330 family)
LQARAERSPPLADCPIPACGLIDSYVKDPVAYEHDNLLGEIAMEKAGRRFLARDGAIEVLEGDWKPRAEAVVQRVRRPRRIIVRSCTFPWVPCVPWPGPPKPR